MPWDYRVIQRKSRKQSVYVIHEVGFDEEGEMESITAAPVYPAAESIEKLRAALEWMIEALDKAVIQAPKELEEAYFEPFAHQAYKLK